MNYALSQRRPDRHPVGLMIVVGLHVVLAAALLSAKLKGPDAQSVPIELHPIDLPKPIVEKTIELPSAPLQKLTIAVPIVPPIEVDPTDAIQVPVTNDKPAVTAEPTLIAMQDKPHDPVRVTPRSGSLNAGSEKCRPEYPAAASRLGVTGVSRIRFSVDAAGHVLGAQILQSSGPLRENRILDQAAAAALARCPVTMGTDDQGRAVPFTTDVDYIWSMN